MINIVFTINREIFRITINNKEIYYTDRRWKKEIRLIPKDEKFIYKIRMSRNKIPQRFISLFELTKEEEAEYSAAKTEQDLADICIKDARKKGAIVVKVENDDDK